MRLRHLLEKFARLISLKTDIKFTLPGDTVARVITQNIVGKSAELETAKLDPPVEGQVDLVYYWVDSSDKSYAEDRVKWMQIEGVAMSDQNKWSPPRDNSELRHSLRSVHLHAPFVRNIYIVTNNQRPSWLNTDHPRINIVDVADLLPEQSPVFNNHAICSAIHKIEGISEWFLQADDDFFVTEKISLDYFFDKQSKQHISYMGIPRGNHDPHTGLPTMAQLILDQFDVEHCNRHVRWCGHCFRLYHKSIFEEIWVRFPEQMARTASSRFRAGTDIDLSSFVPYYMANTGRGIVLHEADIRGIIRITEDIEATVAMIDSTVDRLPPMIAMQDWYDKPNFEFGSKLDSEHYDRTCQYFYDRLYREPSPFEL